MENNDTILRLKNNYIFFKKVNPMFVFTPSQFLIPHLQYRCNTIDCPPRRWRSRLSLENAIRDTVGLLGRRSCCRCQRHYGKISYRLFNLEVPKAFFFSYISSIYRIGNSEMSQMKAIYIRTSFKVQLLMMHGFLYSIHCHRFSCSKFTKKPQISL